MTSKRSVARRLDSLEGNGGGDPFELVITESVVGSDWEPRDGCESEYGDLASGESIQVSRLRCGHDERGNWYSERVDLRGDE